MRLAVRLLLFFLSTVLLPFVVVGAFLFSRRIREGMSERLGLGGWRSIKCRNHPRIWLHAASVGEVGGLLPVLRKLKSKFPNRELIVTTTSLTGRKAVEESGLATQVCLLPFDHPWILRRAIRRVSPDVCLIFETEIWPNLYLELFNSSVKTLLVNGRISDYSYPQYRRASFFQKYFLDCLTHVFAQTEVDKERFASLGVPADRITVSGSTKYEQTIELANEESCRKLSDTFGLSFGSPCLVAGSVREFEDAIVLDSYLSLREKVPGLQLIIAPRHPERFDSVADLIRARGVKFSRRSAIDDNSEAPVLLLDTIGELRSCYGLASVAFVGGSLVDVGGHNPLEPAAYSVPVVFGPYISTVRDAASALVTSKGGVMVSDQAELTQVVLTYLRNEAERESAGRAAYRVWLSNQGAGATLFKYLDESITLG